MPDLQEITDSLSAQLSRSVTVDDAELKVLAYTIFEDQVDRMRTDAILRKATPAASAEWLMGKGISQATTSVRLPANTSLGQLPRVCAPVRKREILLGYLWLIDPDESLTDEELGLVDAAAAAAADVMFHDAHVRTERRRRVVELARALLADSEPVRQEACTALATLDAFTFTGFAAVMVLSAEHHETRTAAEDLLEGALERASRLLPPQRSLWFADGGTGVLMSSHADLAQLAFELERVSALLLEQAAVTFGEGGRAVVGVGDPVRSALDMPRSARQAQLAAFVAGATGMDGRPLAYADLGPYRLLGALSMQKPGLEELDPGLRRLIDGDHGQLLETLEAYLDAAGDATATAEALHIHRTTLYYRLGRIHEVTGAELTDGSQRLALHMSIKLARLCGLLEDDG